MENNSNSGVIYQGKIPNRVKYCFAFGALGKDLIYGMIATFSMIYFTDIIKVAPAFIGSMFFVAKLWDAFNDLFMGMIVDNTRSRWGKFVPWLVIGTLINAFVFITVFTDFHLSGVSLCVFASVVYVLWGMTYTIMDIPYWSIIPNLTSDPEEREKVSVLPRIFASIGQSLIIAGFGVQIIKGLGGNYTGYHRFALIIAATFIFTMAVCVINLPKKQQATGTAEKMKFRDIFTVIKKNDQLRWAVLLILLYNIGIQAIMGVATYYFSYVCNNAGMLSAFMISASVAEVVGLLIFPKVTKLLSRKKAFLMACTLPPIGLILLLIVGFVCPSNIPLTAIAGIIVKTGTGLELGCATVFLADVVDYGEYVLGVRNEGVVFSLQTLIVKLTAAFTALAIGFVLELTGYVPNAVQSLATQNSIRVLMCIVPALGIILTLIIILISTITIWKLPQTQNGYTHIGIAVYDMDDTFINDYVTKLQNKIDRSSFSGKKVLYEIFDAEGNANRQEHQLQYMYTQNFDALLINLVTPSSAASVLNETANHDIPVILFNREADKKDLSISKQTWYVGTAAKKAGAIQADMLQNVWNIDKVNLDRNKNNKLDYILIEGEQTHFDAVRRTNGFLESSQNLPLNQLTNLSADWQRNLSSVKFSKLDTSIIQSAEAIICNNDDMALGVYDYYKQHNLKLPLILGINNSPEMNQKIQAGEIYGTVDNGTNDQISYICKLLNDILNKDTAKYHKIWYSKPFAIEK